MYHISFFIHHLKLPFGDHSLRASLSCAGTAVADSPVMTVKCNHLPPVFDEHEGRCRYACARACIFIRNWTLPSHGGRNTSMVTAWSADPFKSHQKILSAFIKLTNGTWLLHFCHVHVLRHTLSHHVLFLSSAAVLAAPLYCTRKHCSDGGLSAPIQTCRGANRISTHTLYTSSSWWSTSGRVGTRCIQVRRSTARTGVLCS